jgi:hypothetical protein
MCTVEFGNTNYKNNFNSLSTVKEVKQCLKRQIIKNNTAGDKMIKLFHNGKELKSDNMLMGDVSKKDEVNLMMICLTLTDDIMNDQKKMDEKVIINLIKNCELHPNLKTNFICISCGTSICSECKEHVEHKVVLKGDIMQYEDNLKSILESLNLKLCEIGINDDNLNTYLHTQDLNKVCEELVNKVEQIKKRIVKIMNNYKLNFDTIFPPVLDYKDKVRELIKQVSENKRETILRNDKDFIEFYSKYQQINLQNEKNNESISMLKKKLDKYLTLISEFKSKTEGIIEFINNQIDKISDYQLTDQAYQRFHVNDTNVEFNDSGHYNSRSKEGSPTRRLTLVNLLNSPPQKGKELGKNFGPAGNKIKLFSASNENKFNKSHNSEVRSNINEENSAVINNNNNDNNVVNNLNNVNNANSANNANNVLNNVNNVNTPNPPTLQKKILSLEVSTKNAYIYNTEDGVITKKELDLSQTVIKKFEAYHSTLNFNNKFYISGGYSPSKVVYEYDIEANEFKRLGNMIYGHSYHSLIGIGMNIYTISGFKNKKVQKYEADKWLALPEVNYARTWPSLINIDNKYIYIIGGLVMDNHDTKSNNIVERLDIKACKHWEVIEISCPQFPYNFASINISSEKIILLGGMLNKNEDTVDKCWLLDLENKTLGDYELKLPSKDEFDGKQFIALDEGNAKFGLFSSVVFEKFYSYDREKNILDMIGFNNS